MKAENVLLGNRIREAREKRRWNKRELAQRAGVVPSYITRIEAAEFDAPSIEKVKAIATALGVAVTDLTDEYDPLPPDLMEQVAEIANADERMLRAIVAEVRRYPSDEWSSALRFIYQMLQAARQAPVRRP